MKKHHNPTADAAKLRRRAEARLQADTVKGAPSRAEADSQRLVHELQVHQIELEMQNEELMQARAELEAALGEYTDLYDFAPVGYLTLGRDGVIRRVNLTGARLLGVERARLTGRPFGFFVGEPDRAGFEAFLEKVFAGQSKEVCEVALLKEDKQPLNVHLTAAVSQDGPECRVMMADITERKKAEVETVRLASFPMLNPRPVVEVDLAGHVHFCNPTALQMFPDLCECGLGHQWLADWESAMRSLREAGPKPIMREVPVGEKWYHQTMHLVEDAQRVRIYGADITARKQAEEALLKANAELEQKVSERTSELAVKIDELRLANEELESRTKQLRLLAAELTLTEQRERKRLSQLLHDGLQQHLLSAKMRLGGVAELIGDVNLKQATNDIEKIIGESVQLSRSLSAALSPPILHEAGLSEGLEWLVRWMRDKHKFTVDLAIETRPELPEDVKILVFESVRELLVNAVKHSKVRRARVGLKPVNGADLRIAVSDAGTGFDPGQLKPPGEEGGFGLFSVHERIGLIGGSVEIDSAPGKGCRVALMVPQGQAPAVPLSADRMCILAGELQEDASKNQGTTIRVLLADDHVLFRNGLDRLLKNEQGLEVVGHASDGEEAVDLAQKLKPDVILMDISMPRLNGIEATRIIHRGNPEILIIGLSMYEDQERAQAMRDAGASDYKTKGCVASELISAIFDCVSRQ